MQLSHVTRSGEYGGGSNLLINILNWRAVREQNPWIVPPQNGSFSQLLWDLDFPVGFGINDLIPTFIHNNVLDIEKKISIVFCFNMLTRTLFIFGNVIVNWDLFSCPYGKFIFHHMWWHLWATTVLFCETFHDVRANVLTVVFLFYGWNLSRLLHTPLSFLIRLT